jgi:integrase
LAALESPKQAPLLSHANLTSLVERLLQRKERQLAAFVALAWLLAGRLGEIALIPLSHFFSLELPVRVKFTMMKGVFGAQEKSLPEGYLCQVVCSWHHRLSRSQLPPRRLFSLTPAQVIACLRKEVDPFLSGHSIRRGALTHGDSRGGSSQDLMTLSSHKSPHMLQRYIGRASSDRREAMLRAGSILAQP